MAYIRVPGKAERYQYVDDETGELGETISRRQYDKRFGVLAQRGFTSYEQQSKASEYKVVGPFPKEKSIWHVYDLGLPQDIARAIETTIDRSPHFGTKMMLSVYGTVYGDGKPFKRWYGTTVWKKKNTQIIDMLKELNEAISDYDIEFVAEKYELTLLDRSEL